jgi:carbonic anhydrase/acetyltransferase-like protein (isoleucine patch superfamily)
MQIPDGMLAAGIPARVAGELTPGAKQWVDNNPEIYRARARRHASSVRPVAG